MTYTLSTPTTPTDLTFSFADNLCYLSDNRVLGLFYDPSGNLRAFVIHSDGQKVTGFGSSVYMDAVSTLDGTVPVACRALDATHVLVFYSAPGTHSGFSGFDCRAAVLQVVGDTITVGTPFVVDFVASTNSNENIGFDIAVQSGTSATVALSLQNLNVAGSPSGPFKHQKLAQLTVNPSALTITSVASTVLLPDHYDSPNVVTLDAQYALASWNSSTDGSGGSRNIAAYDTLGNAIGTIVTGYRDQSAGFSGLCSIAPGVALLMSDITGTLTAYVVSNSGTPTLSFGVGAAPGGMLDTQYSSMVALSSTHVVAQGYTNSVSLGHTFYIVDATITGASVTFGSLQTITPVIAQEVPIYCCKLNSTAIIGTGTSGYEVVYGPPILRATPRTSRLWKDRG